MAVEDPEEGDPPRHCTDKQIEVSGALLLVVAIALVVLIGIVRGSW